MKITAITAPNPGPFTLDGTKTYILGDTAVVDPGPANEAHVAAILEAAPRLETILITHRHGDHAPGAVPLKQACGARIFAPREVLSDDLVDERISGGERIGIADSWLDVIATPGHTNEHVCFLTAEGELFTGDTILGAGTTAIFPPDGHMGDYLATLRKLIELQPKRIYPAHGPVREDAPELIREYLEHRLARERQVLSAVGDGSSTIPELRRRIYSDLDASLYRAAEIQLWAHLIKLVEEGRVVEASPGSYARRGA